MSYVFYGQNWATKKKRMARIEKRGELTWHAPVRRDGIEESKAFIIKANALALAQETELTITHGH